jgi:hypothetical protein
MKTLHDTTGGGKSDDLERANTVTQLRRMFGARAVLLPCAEKSPRDKSGRKMAGWQKLTPAVMNDPFWFKELCSKPQIGVLCGDNSGGLLCVDLDEAAALAAFQGALPDGTRTTKIIGQPGRAKYFFRLPHGMAGKKQKLYRSGAEIGDWIANAAQAIVSGVHHKTGQPYRIDDDSPPMDTTVEQIKSWLLKAGLTLGRRENSQQGSQCYVECSNVEMQDAGMQNAGCRENPQIFSPLPPSGKAQIAAPNSVDTDEAADDVLASIEIEKKVTERLAEQPPAMQKLWRDHIGEKFPIGVRQRNAFIVAAMPALIRRVAPEIARKLALLQYDLHKELFADPRERHAYEAGEMLDAALRTYCDALSAKEGAIYNALTAHEQAIFRICRDLARHRSRVAPPSFILSAEELGIRLGIPTMAAYRLLNRFATRLHLIDLVEKGTRRAQGVKGKASVYRWRISMEPWPEGAPS